MFGLKLRNLCRPRAPTRLDVGRERQPRVGVDSSLLSSRPGDRPLVIPLGDAHEDTSTRFPRVRGSRFSILSPMLGMLVPEFWQCSPQHLVWYLLQLILLATAKALLIQNTFLASPEDHGEQRNEACPTFFLRTSSRLGA